MAESLAAQGLERRELEMDEFHQMLAYEEGDLVLAWVKKFRRNGGDLNIRNVRGFTPLMLAAYYNQAKVVEYMLQQPEVKIDKKSPEGENVLYFIL